MVQKENGRTNDFDEKNQASIFSSIPQFARLTGNSKKINEIKEKILLVADTSVTLIFSAKAELEKQLPRKSRTKFPAAKTSRSLW